MIFLIVQCQCIIQHPVVMTKLALNPQQIKPLNFSVFTLFDTDPGHWAKILKWNKSEVSRMFLFLYEEEDSIFDENGESNRLGWTICLFFGRA